MRIPTRAAARPLIAVGAALATIAFAGATPVAANPLTQKAGAAGCVGEAPCTVGVETFMARSTAVSPDGRNVYVAAIGNGALTVFDRAVDGTLHQKSGTAGCISSRAGQLLPGFCVQATAMRGAFSVAVSPDGRSVYVASLLSSAVAVFDRAADGTVEQKAGSGGCIADDGAPPCADGVGLGGAQAITVSADGASVYVAATSDSGGANAGSIAVFDRAADGVLTQKAGSAGCVSETGSAPCADGRALMGARAVATSADGANVYAVSADGVAVFDRDADGTLAQKTGDAGCVSDAVAATCALGRALSGPMALTMSADGSNVYVTAGGGALTTEIHSTVAVFDRGATGALTQKPGAAGCISNGSVATCATATGLAQAIGVAASPDGASVYVLSRSWINDWGFTEGPGSIANFDRAADGTLAQPAGAVGCVSDVGAGDPCSEANRSLRGGASLTISPDGRSAYVAGGSGLAIFDRGTPLPAPPPPPPPPPAPDVTRPLLRGLALTPARFRASARGESLVARGGTRLSFRLSEPASVRFTVSRVVSGRRSGGRCVAVRRSNRSAKPCDRYGSVPGSFISLVPAGARSMRFSGRVRNRKLALGFYRLRGVASDAAGNRSRTAVARFAIRR